VILRAPARRLAAAAMLACLAGCHASTDRRVYETGEPGTVTLVNRSHGTGYLPGCQAFSYERLEAGSWVEAPDVVCVWEGLPVPVPPGSELTFAFTAREPARGRLRFDLRVDCQPWEPLSQVSCGGAFVVVSNEFEVREPTDRACRVSGCSGELCASETLASACVFLPHFACFRDAACSERGELGPDPGCGWERTPELEACLARFSVSPAELGSR
jgi:hypothetical protein